MRFAVFFAAFVLWTASAMAQAMKWNVAQIDGRRYVPVTDVARFYGFRAQTSTAREFVLTGSGRRVQGRGGTGEITINGVKYLTCFPLRSHNGAVHMSAMDVTKLLEPILRPSRIKTPAPLRTVVLDAGHGGHDAGAVGPLGREKAYALDVALRARALLLQAGYSVRMTRSTDVFIPLHERSAFANRFEDGVMVSIHFNKSKNAQGTGIETFTLAPRGVASMDGRGLSHSDFREQPGNARDSENIALAAAIHSSMVRNLPLTDRGVKRARFHVIRATRIPSVLLEGGFMNHPQDSRLIANPEFRQRMALSILQGVEAYKKALNPSGPAPSLIVSGDQPSSIPDLDRPGATPEPTPTPMPELKPLPPNWHLGYPPGRKARPEEEQSSDAEAQEEAAEMDGHVEEPEHGEMEESGESAETAEESAEETSAAPPPEIHPLPANWNIGYPPGRKNRAPVVGPTEPF